MPNKKKLFNALVQEGYDNFDSESSFNAYIDNADNRKKLFNALKEEGYDNFSDEKAFDEYLGYGSETQSKPETYETQRVGNTIIGGIGTQEEADSIFDANAKAIREKYSNQPDQEQNIPESELKRLQSIKDTAQKQIDEAGFFDRFFDADTRAAVAARNQAEEALETYEEAQHAENGWFDRNVMGVLRGIADKATDLSTWDFGVSGIASATALNDAYEKWEKGEQLTSAEQNMLDAYGLATAVQAAYQDKVGTAYKVGGSLPESAAFSASFILNPAAGVGKKLAEATAKAAVKKYGTSLVSKLAKGAARAGGDVAEMAVATAIPGGFRVAEDYYNRLNGQSTFDIDENGIIRYGGQAEQEEADDAIWKAFGSQFIENYSEAMGNYFAPMGTMLSNLTSKGLKAAHLGKLADVVNDISSSQFSRGLKRFKEATKFDGLVGEYLEEVAGNVINAATVGDMNFNSPEDPRSVFNPETNIETFLSCALMSGTMYAVEAPVSIYNRNVAKRNLNNADTEASKLWGDRWNDMRSQMDEADPQLLAQLLTGVQNAEDLSDEQKSAAMEYGKRLMQYQGYNARRVQNQKESTDEANEINNAYDEGAEIQTPSDKHKAKVELDKAEAELGAGSEDADSQQFASMVMDGKDNPVQTITSMAEQGYSDEQIQKAKDYYTAYHRMNGLTDALLENVNSQIESAKREVDANTNKDNGSVIKVMLRDRRWGYVVEGTVVRGEKGTVDVNNSDDTIMVRLENGEVKMMNPNKDLFRVAWIDSPENVKEEINVVLREKLIDKAIGEIDWNPATPSPEIGDSFEMNGAPVIIVGQDANGGILVVPTEEWQASQGNEKQMQQLVVSAQQSGSVPVSEYMNWASAQIDAQEEAAATQQEAAVQEIASTEMQQEEEPIVNEGTVSEQETKQQTLEDIVASLPKTKKGDIDYSAMTPQQQYQYTSLSESPEVALEDLQADIAANEAEISKVQEQLANAKGGKRAELRDKIRRMTYENEELKTFLGSVAPAPVENDVDDNIEPVRLEDPVVKAARPNRKPIPEDEQPMNTMEFVAQQFALGNIKLLRQSLAEETGYGNEELGKFIRMWAKPENGGVSVERAGEILMETDRELGTNFFNQDDANAGRNAILELFGMARTWGDIAGLIKNNRALEEKRRLEDERAKYEEWVSANIPGMTADEYDLFEETFFGELQERSLSEAEINDFISTFVDEFNVLEYGRYQEGSSELGRQAELNEQQGVYPESEGSGEILYGAQPLQARGNTGIAEESTEANVGVVGENGNVPESTSGSEVISELEKAREEVDQNPTEAQKEAGNYKKGHIKIDGYDITIENPKGGVRSGTDKNGKEWSITMNNDYGYIRGTEAVDGDHIDVFLSENPTEGNVFVVDQSNEDGSFDESKVMYGFNSLEEARAAYLSNYEKGWESRIMAITEVSKDEFKKWIDSSHRKTKAFSEYKSVKANEQKPYTIEPATYTTKKGKVLDMFLVKPTNNEMSRERQSEARFWAKDMRGWYDRKEDGWMLRSKEDADKFVEKVFGDMPSESLDLVTMKSVTDGDVSFSEPIKSDEYSPTWQYIVSVDRESGFTTLRRDDVSGPIPIGDARFTIQATSPEEMLDILRNPLNGMQEVLGSVEVTLENSIKTRELDRKIKEERKRKYEELRKNGLNGFKIGDKVVYTPLDKTRKPIEATIYDFEEFGEHNPVLDTGLAPVMYEVVQWGDISKVGKKTEEQPKKQYHGGDRVFSTKHNANKDIYMAHHVGESIEYLFTDGTKANENEVQDALPEYKEKPNTNPSGNKLVTDERYAELRERMKKKLGGQMNIGIDPEILAIGTEMAVYHIEKGARKFAEYAKEMISDLGDAIRPYLKAFYNGARDLPEVQDAGLASEMTPYEEVNSFDVTNFDKNTINVIETAENIAKEAVVEEQKEIAKVRVKKQKKTSKKQKENVSLLGDLFNQNTESNDETRDQQRRKSDELPEGDKTQNSGMGSEAREESAGSSVRGEAGSVPGYNVSDTSGSGRIHGVSVVQQPIKNNIRNFSFGESHIELPTGEISKLKANIEAIRTLKEIEASGQPATESQKAVLSKYVGWGGLSAALDEQKYLNSKGWLSDRNWNEKYLPYYIQLKELLNVEEFNDAVQSTTTSHYTPEEIIRGMWSVVEESGFKGGRINEPAAGVGHIIGFMPKAISEKSTISGTEIDSLSGRIAKVLYPDANIKVQGYEKEFTPQSKDLVITNVPFGKTAPYDKALDKTLRKKLGSAYNLHNYFIAKGLLELKEGGIGVFVTSSATMDGANSKFREWVAANGVDLVGAIRLPNNAFLKNAGTSVTADMLVFRKRKQGERSNGVNFISNTQIGEGTYKENGETRTKPIMINEYFAERPEMMLGTMMTAHDAGSGGLYSGASQTLVAKPGADLKKELQDAISKIDMSGFVSQSTEKESIPTQPKATDLKNGTLVVEDNNVFVAVNGELQPVESASKKKEFTFNEKKRKVADAVSDYNSLKETLKSLIKAEQSNVEDPEPLRKELNRKYDSFVEKYGTLNRNKALDNIFAEDFEHNLPLSLENVRRVPSATGKSMVWEVTKGEGILTKRVSYPVEEPKTAESLDDAINISRSYRGIIDVPYIASLLNKSELDVMTEILQEGLAYRDPITGNLEDKGTYLSGNVREKLEQARAMAETYPEEYQKNVDDLAAVQPETVRFGDISYRIGTPWIPTQYINDFALDVLGIKDLDVAYVPTLNEFVVSKTARLDDFAKSGQFRTERVGVIDLIEYALNQRKPKIFDKRVTYGPFGKSEERIPNEAETQAAAEKIMEISDKFIEYIDGRKEIHRELERIYNDKYNNYRLKEYEMPSFDHYPNSNREITLRDHQKKAVQRCLSESTLLAHQVGTGKTFTMITTAMEMRRLGIANKPMIVVQNATLEDFVKDFYKLYPGANVLAPGKDERSAENRKRLFNLIATGDFDAIVIPQSFMQFIPDDEGRKKELIQKRIDEYEQAMLAIDDRTLQIRMQKELDALRDTLEDVKSDKKKKRSVKDLANAGAKIKVKTEQVLDRRTDDVLTFEQMGIDALFIDEAHNFKKIGFASKMSNVKGIDTSVSQRANSLLLKAQYVQEKNGGRNVILATGTPITNTMAEVWTMMKFVSPEILETYNIRSFDDFATTFGVVEPSLEFAATGNFKIADRFKSYVNVPELVKAFRSHADVVLSGDVKEFKEDNRIPKLKDGQMTNVVIEKNEDLEDVMDILIKRLETYNEMSGEEKRRWSALPLVVFSRAKQAAIDLRLLNPSYEDNPNSKTNHVVRNVLKLYKESTPDKGAQLVFCDSYQSPGEAPKMDLFDYDPDVPRFNLYEDIKRKLVEGGIPSNEIAIVNNYDGERRKQLFEKVRNGDVRILLGSTEKMGVGVNVQDRLYALHHIDAPIRPMDFEQRNGRILRQGNLYATWGKPVNVVTYGVQGTLDATAYDRLRVKQDFINQMMKGDVSGRVMEEQDDEDPSGMTFNQMAATLSGDQTAQLLFVAENQLKKLRNSKRSDANSKSGMAESMQSEKQRLETLNSKAQMWESANATVNKYFPEGVTDITVNGTTFTEKLGPALDPIVDAFEEEYSLNRGIAPLKMKLNGGNAEVIVHFLEGRMVYELYAGKNHIVESRQITGGKGLVSSIEHQIKATKKNLDETNAKIAEIKNKITGLAQAISTPWGREEELKEAEKKVADLKKQLEEKALENSKKKPVEQPSNEVEVEDVMYRTSNEIDKEYPNWLEGTTTESGKHSTQVEGTRKTYNKVGTWIEENLGKNVSILDASSGMGYGTADLRERGFNIEDVEPYQSEERKKNNPATYSSYGDIEKKYDYIISNAVLNVIPDDWRRDVLHDMAKRLKEGGHLFINTRKAGEEKNIKDKIELDSPQEVLVKRNGKIASYQRFFTPMELKSWVENELGEGYIVNVANKNNSGTNGLAAVVVTKESDFDREGIGPYTEDEVSMANDPVGKVLGKSTRTASERKSFAERERQRMIDRVTSLAKKLGLKNVEIVTDASTLTGAQRKAKGFYSKSKRKITIVIPNHSSVFDAEQTLLHEAVAHYGLRELFGAHFDVFLNNVYRNASSEVRERINRLAEKNGWDFSKATEEYLASLAEDTNFENMDESWWNKIKQFFLDMLHQIGFPGFSGVTLTDNELRYILWRSYENLAEPGKYRSIFGEAADIVKQDSLKVGNYASSMNEEYGAVAEGNNYNEMPEDIIQEFEEIVANHPDIYAVRTEADIDALPTDRYTKRDIKEKFNNPRVTGTNVEGGMMILFVDRMDEAELRATIPHELAHFASRNLKIEESYKMSALSYLQKHFPNSYEKVKEYPREKWSEEAVSHLFEEKVKELGFERILNGKFDTHNDIGYIFYNITKFLNHGKRNNPLRYGERSRSQRANDGEGNRLLQEKGVFGNVERRIQRETKESVSGNDRTGNDRELGSVSGTSMGMGYESRTRQEEVEDDNLYRTGDDIEGMADNTARRLYEDSLKGKSYRFQEGFQDSMLALKKLQESIVTQHGGKLEEWEDAYTAENQMSSRDTAEIENYTFKFFNPLLEQVNMFTRKTGLSYDELKTYLFAKSGLERNRDFAVRDSISQRAKDGEDVSGIYEAYMQRKKDLLDDLKTGVIDFRTYCEEMDNEAMTVAPDITGRDYSGISSLFDPDNFTEEAINLVESVEQSAGWLRVESLWDSIKAANQFTLDRSKKSGVMSTDNHKKVSEMFEWYIPMRGWNDTKSRDVYEYFGSQEGVFNPTVKAAGGRKSLADDPLATMANMAESAIFQGNKNQMKQKLLNLAFDKPTNLITVMDSWIENKGTEKDPKWEYVYPDISQDDDADVVSSKIKIFEEEMNQKADEGRAKKIRGKADVPYIATPKEIAEHIIRVKRNGREFVMILNGNPRAAQAINGMTNPETYNGIIERVSRRLNQFMASAFTTKNPTFIMRNLSRDLIFSNTAVAIKENVQYGRKFRSNQVKVLGNMRGLMKRYRSGNLDMNNDLDRMFKEFIANGGETGFAQLTSVDEYKKKIQRNLKDAQKGGVVSNGKKVGRFVMDTIEFYNRCAEDVSRFTVYMTSRQEGRSIQRSVNDAKEITVNFNKRGSGSKAGGFIGFGAQSMRSLYLFWNAAVQALVNFKRLGQKHPVAFTSAISLYAASGFIMPVVNEFLSSILGGDDDDYENLPEWVRRNNLVISLGKWDLFGGDAIFFTVPLPVEMRAFYGLGETANQVLAGNVRGKDAAMQIVGQFAEMLPLNFVTDAAGPWNAFTPDAFKPIVQAYIANKDWTGKPIYRDNGFNKDLPEWTKAYAGTSNWLVNSAELINELTGGDKYKSGLVDINPSRLEHLFTGYLGGFGDMILGASKTMQMPFDEKYRNFRHVPVIKAFVNQSDERTSYSQVKKDYASFKDEYEETVRRINGYKKERRNPEKALEYAERTQFLNESIEMRRYDVMRRYEKQLNKLYKQMRENPDTEVQKSINETINQIKADAVKALRAVK